MKREDARKGMEVVFGRPNGEKTLAKIEKCNPTKAKVITLEERGRSDRPAGVVWNVPYCLMEPKPESGNKHEVVIKSRHEQETDSIDIIVGVTTFRSGLADGVPLWKVVQKQGKNYLCKVIPDEDEEFEGDWIGTERVFMPSQIAMAIASDIAHDKIMGKHANFYDSLKVGDIVHYENRRDQWVRCEVVEQNGKNALKPIALVGNWDKFDLPRRDVDGTIWHTYHSKIVVTGKVMTPNVTTIFEARKFFDGVSLSPIGLKPIDLTVPPMTSDQQRVADDWKKIKELKEILEGDNAHVILANVSTWWVKEME